MVHVLLTVHPSSKEVRMRDSEQLRRWVRGITAKQPQAALRGSVLGMAILMSISAWGETPGEHFREAMEKKAEYCATHKIQPGNRRCDILKLKPADPLMTEEGRFAHSIKIPNPVPEDSGYKSGMTPQEYFEHLCKTEAGEFVYKTVENVEGLHMMRPREHATDYMQEHLYAMEDPYGYTDWEADRPQTIFVNPPWGLYSFLEVSLAPSIRTSVSGAKYQRFSGYMQDRSPMIEERVSEMKSRYGYTWRGISRPHDRELGIAGGELIVLDLQVNEVLGVRRGFIRSGGVRNNGSGIWWLSAQVCPTLRHDKRIQKDGDFTYWFISKVLKPVASSTLGGLNAAK
jgi:hypothetical protein